MIVLVVFVPVLLSATVFVELRARRRRRRAEEKKRATVG
jgi:hypothetical protein